MNQLKNAMIQFNSMKGSLFRYSLSFCILISLLPTLIIIIYLIQISFFDVNSIFPILYQYVPQELIEPFVEYLMSKNFNSFISVVISFIFTCIIASKSFYSLMLISSNTEKFKTYKILIRIKAIILFIVILALVIAISIFVTRLNINLYIAYGIGLLIVFYLAYRMLSFQKRGAYYGIAGAIFSSVSVILIGELFSYIVSNYMSYQNVYGPLSSLMVLMLSIYIISNVIYFGYCLNDVYAKININVEYKSVYFYHFGESIIDLLKSKLLRGELNENKNRKNGN